MGTVLIQQKVKCYAGRAYARAGTHKGIRLARKVSDSEVSRTRNGEAPNAPLYKGFFELASCEFTSAWSALTEGRVLVKRESLARYDTVAELRARQDEIGYEVVQLVAELAKHSKSQDDVNARRVLAELSDLGTEGASIIDEILDRTERGEP